MCGSFIYWKSKQYCNFLLHMTSNADIFCISVPHWSHGVTQSWFWIFKKCFIFLCKCSFTTLWKCMANNSARSIAAILFLIWLLCGKESVAANIFHFPHVSILWYIQIVVPVIKKIFDKNTLRFTTFIFPHCASSNGLHGRIHNHTDYISTLSVFKCVLKMRAQVDKKLRQLQFFCFSPLWLFKGFPMALLPEHK